MSGYPTDNNHHPYIKLLINTLKVLKSYFLHQRVEEEFMATRSIA